MSKDYDFSKIGRVSVLPATDHRPHHAPASETHKQRNADDYRATPAAERPALLRRIVGAEYNHAYKGRTNILDEVADGVSELAARGELDGDNLEVLLDAVKNELEARKAAAAMTNAHKAKLAKTSPVRLGEHTVTRDKKPDEKTQTPGKLEGGLFGAKTMQNEPLFWVTGSGKIYPATPGLPAANQDDFGPYTRTQAEAALKRVQNEQVPEASDNVDDFLKDAPPADDKPTCKNEWALDPKKLVAYQDRIEYIASEAGVGMKEARAWGLKWFAVPDETQIPMSASDALKFIKAQLPTSIDEQVEAAQEAEAARRSPVEVVVKEQKPVEKPQQTEASVIIFAKSDIFLSLPNGASVTLSVTLRDGASFEEVQRLIGVYTQMLSLPTISTARPALQPAAQPVAAPMVPNVSHQTAVVTAPQMAPAPVGTNLPADPRGNVPGTTINAQFAYVKRNEVNGKTEVELYPAKNDGTPGDFVMPGGYLKEKALALFPAAELAALQPGVLTPRQGILTAIVANKQSSKGYYYLNAQHITLS